jgi:hypothetical protein
MKAKLQIMKKGDNPPVSNKEFLTNWYKNRVIPDNDIQAAFEKDKPLLMDRLNNLPSTKIVDVFERAGNSGIDNKNVNAQYDPRQRLILMKKNTPSWVETHELNHAINDINSYTWNAHKDIVNNEIVPRKDAKGVYRDKYEYFTNPDEVHSRIMVLRQAAGIKPDQVVTEEYLDNFMKNYKGDNSNINDLLNLSKGKEGLLNMLNYMAVNKSNKNLTQV